MFHSRILLIALLFLQTNPAMGNELDLSTVLGLDKPVNGDFRQLRSVSGVDREFVTRGMFTVLGQSALLWRVTSPEPMRIIFTEDSVKYLEGNDKANTGISRYVSQLVRDIMTLGILSNKEFESAVTGDASAWQLELTPQRKSVRRHLERILINGDEFIRKLQVISGDGSHTEITFTNIKYSDDLPKELCQVIDVHSDYCP